MFRQAQITISRLDLLSSLPTIMLHICKYAMDVEVDRVLNRKRKNDGPQVAGLKSPLTP